MVTWAQIGWALVLIVGVLAAGFGALATFAAMMSDAPSDTGMARTGCRSFLLGLVAVVVAVAMLAGWLSLG